MWSAGRQRVLKTKPSGRRFLSVLCACGTETVSTRQCGPRPLCRAGCVRGVPEEPRALHRPWVPAPQQHPPTARLTPCGRRGSTSMRTGRTSINVGCQRPSAAMATGRAPTQRPHGLVPVPFGVVTGTLQRAESIRQGPAVKEEPHSYLVERNWFNTFGLDTGESSKAKQKLRCRRGGMFKELQLGSSGRCRDRSHLGAWGVPRAGVQRGTLLSWH